MISKKTVLEFISEVGRRDHTKSLFRISNSFSLLPLSQERGIRNDKKDADYSCADKFTYINSCRQPDNQ
ncbi:MAG: hypothetical protein LBG96_03410 [Tannerella sp.]|nr:hypothetical protein [Tannerella sp.]